jgi:nicotinate-nucleotide--dimethylbenzimidazole phosphoribosyltransferase
MMDCRSTPATDRIAPMNDRPPYIDMPVPDSRAESEARARQLQLTKPPGSLGRLEELACWFAARTRNPIPEISHCEIFVFAADHGVASQGVSAFPQAVTGQMVANFAGGGAAINVLATLEKCPIEVVDVGVASDAEPPRSVRREKVRAGTRDLLVEAAMTDDELTAALEVGARCAREAIRRGAQLLIAGDMGIANTTAAACLICAFTDTMPEQVVGRGTGVDDAGLDRKREVVTAALARARKAIGTPASPAAGAGNVVGTVDPSAAIAGKAHGTPGSRAAGVSSAHGTPDSRAAGISGANAFPDPAAAGARKMLAHVGGLEIAAMAGFYIEAARNGVPVLLDGYISGAAALAAVRLEPGTVRWMLASHRSAEGGHGYALQALGLNPLVDLGMRLGEGSGAALTLPIIKAALALHRNMATFASAGVDGKSP